MFQVWVEYNGHWLFVDNMSDEAAAQALASRIGGRVI
jgi:hypothetical protein